MCYHDIKKTYFVFSNVSHTNGATFIAIYLLAETSSNMIVKRGKMEISFHICQKQFKKYGSY